MNELNDCKVAILATDGFEEVELSSPRKALDEAGATTHIVSLKPGSIRAMKQHEWSDSYTVDKTLDEVTADDYDALLLPGGVANPDALRINEAAIRFTQAFFKAGKPVAAICHGPQLLINAEVVEGREMTSVSNISKDLINAGARWEDSEVVVDQGLVTSRTPDDLPAFNAKIVEEFAEGKHAGQHA